MIVAEIKEKYEHITNTYKNKDLKSINCYTCEHCQHITKTINVDKGVIPYMFRCPNCKGYAYSSYFENIAPFLDPTIEWYRPTIEDTIQLNALDLEHILNGGLMFRNVRKENKCQPA